MNLQQLHPDFAEEFLATPVYADRIWQDIPATRAFDELMREKIAAELAPVESVITSDHLVPGSAGEPDVSVRLYAPANHSAGLPALLWIHGGGYVMGSMLGDDYMVKKMVEAVGCAVVSVDYRLAPEHPFPAPLEDCYAALNWLFSQSQTLQLDSTRIAIGGISAGGGLAAALALLARDRGEFAPVFQMLLCPMIDDNNSTPSSHRITDQRTWNRHCNINGWAAYLGQQGTDSPYAAAARATDLSGLPPAYIPVGSLDLFVDENAHYAQRLEAAGVPVEFSVYPGGVHAFEFIYPLADVSARARDSHYRALKRALNIIA